MHVDSFKEKNISDNGPIVLTLEDTFFLFKLLYCLLGLLFYGTIVPILQFRCGSGKVQNITAALPISLADSGLLAIF